MKPLTPQFLWTYWNKKIPLLGKPFMVWALNSFRLRIACIVRRHSPLSVSKGQALLTTLFKSLAPFTYSLEQGTLAFDHNGKCISNSCSCHVAFAERLFSHSLLKWSTRMKSSGCLPWPLKLSFINLSRPLREYPCLFTCFFISAVNKTNKGEQIERESVLLTPKLQKKSTVIKGLKSTIHVD